MRPSSRPSKPSLPSPRGRSGAPTTAWISGPCFLRTLLQHQLLGSLSPASPSWTAATTAQRTTTVGVRTLRPAARLCPEPVSTRLQSIRPNVTWSRSDFATVIILDISMHCTAQPWLSDAPAGASGRVSTRGCHQSMFDWVMVRRVPLLAMAQVDSAAAYMMARRSYHGLEAPVMGPEKKEATVALEGRSGRAAQYSGEPSAAAE